MFRILLRCPIRASRGFSPGRPLARGFAGTSVLAGQDAGAKQHLRALRVLPRILNQGWGDGRDFDGTQGRALGENTRRRRSRVKVRYLLLNLLAVDTLSDVLRYHDGLDERQDIVIARLGFEGGYPALDQTYPAPVPRRPHILLPKPAPRHRYPGMIAGVRRNPILVRIIPVRHGELADPAAIPLRTVILPVIDGTEAIRGGRVRRPELHIGEQPLSVRQGDRTLDDVVQRRVVRYVEEQPGRMQRRDTPGDGIGTLPVVVIPRLLLLR